MIPKLHQRRVERSKALVAQSRRPVFALRAWHAFPRLARLCYASPEAKRSGPGRTRDQTVMRNRLLRQLRLPG